MRPHHLTVSPFRAPIGFTPETCNAAGRARDITTANAMVAQKPSTRQSGERASLVGATGELIMLTTKGVDHHANRVPTPTDAPESKALSISIICNRRRL